jgi:hypothetical protein
MSEQYHLLPDGFFDNQIVRDFFYVETDRVSSMAAQLNANGARNSVTETRTSTTGNKLTGGFGSPAKTIAHISGEISVADADNRTEAYNPFIKEIGEFSQFVKSRESIPPKAIGVSQLRDIVGSMALYDVEAFKAMLNDQNINSLIKDKWKIIAELFDSESDVEEQQKKQNEPRSQVKQKRDRIALSSLQKSAGETRDFKNQALVYSVAAMFKTLDIPVIGNIVDDEGRTFWFTLNKKFLSHVNGELILKYKGQIPGLWTVACIIDDTPGLEIKAHWPALDEVLNEFHTMREQAVKIDYLISPLVIYRELEI